MNEVRRSQRSAANRIASIQEDADFVEHVAEIYHRPLVPNRRAGLWYVLPERKAAEAYFKSTDGHINAWKFSLKRLNLHLVPLIAENDGIILIDTTRRGKKMPDALSKTVPIWCAVLNSAILNTDLSSFPIDCVSASEQDRIRKLLPEFIDQFRTVDRRLWPKLDKPLRPLFVTPNDPLPLESVDEVFSDAYPVICLTASKQAQDGEIQANGYAYVQGAADDHELWAPAAFSPEMLWSNANLREPGITEEELRRRIDTARKPDEKESQPVRVTAHLSIASSRHPGYSVIDVSELPEGKKGVKQLSSLLPRICEQFEKEGPEQTLIVGHGDFPQCVALMLDCRYYNEGVRHEPRLWVSKEDVMQRNAWIIANAGSPPSRTAQNAIGTFLRSNFRVPTEAIQEQK